MSNPLNNSDFDELVEVLPSIFRKHLKNETTILAQAFPLLNTIGINRNLVEKVQTCLNIPAAPLGQDKLTEIVAKFTALEEAFDDNALFQYPLPIILSEFPIHSRIINKSIDAFNTVIDSYHRGLSGPLDISSLGDCFKAILKDVKTHGSYCDAETLWPLLGMMAGWSKVSPVTILKINKVELIATKEEVHAVPLNDKPVVIKELEQPKFANSSKNPFILNYNYNFNSAGRLANETEYLLLNAFGLKIGGHFDAQVKYPPRFMPIEQFHALLHRQLSHRLEIPNEVLSDFQFWVGQTLDQLGVEFKQIAGSETRLVNPLLTDPISFLNPEKIQSTLKTNLSFYEALDFSKAEVEIVSKYLFELLQGFQINPGQALGIGANWDGTINLSNESGAYAFKFKEELAPWGKRFKELSLHRQGPSEAKMNASIGIEFETQAIVTSLDYMSQLQPSEYYQVIYNALIDNLVADLLPEPAYLENLKYQKLVKQHVVIRNEDNTIRIENYFQPSSQGTYFKDKKGNEKQTPKYRRVGTNVVEDFPKNHTCLEESKDCSAGDPLGPLKAEYFQGLYGTSRGHLVYDPLYKAQFLEDAFYGQVIRSDNDDYVPFIGVMPTNLDSHFNLDKELCASFVIRMMQSAHIFEYCPTFRNTLEQIKTTFLPDPKSALPALPIFCSDYLVEKLKQLALALASDSRQVSQCDRLFHSVFKQLTYSLYDYGRDDEHFKHDFLSFIHAKDTFYPMSRTKCEKIIRDLVINKPVSVSPECFARYEAVLTYLRDITAYFYPKPKDAFAKEIARIAKAHVTPLLDSSSISTYFQELQKNKSTNLSRKQSPGMLYAVLKHEGPLKSVVKEYSTMHSQNFTSYYRDPDGTEIAKPYEERIIDLGAKGLGAGLQLMHKYPVLASVLKPVIQPYLHAKQEAAMHSKDDLQFLWILKGITSGFLWHGVAKGVWKTTTIPMHLIVDFIRLVYQSAQKKKSNTENNPLAIAASPPNTSSVKTHVASSSRDYLLKMLGNTGTIELKQKEVIDSTVQITKQLYPHLTLKEIELYKKKLHDFFPLNNEQWDALLKPLLDPTEHKELSKILQKNNALINKSLVQAVFRCLTHPLFAEQPANIMKDTKSFFALSKEQSEVLGQLLQFYKQMPRDKKSEFLSLFQFNGAVHQSLRVRDQFLQSIQSYILKVFDKEGLLDLLFSEQIDELTLELSVHTAMSSLSKLPANIKWPLYQVLSSNNLNVLDEYSFSKKQRDFIITFHKIYNQITEQTDKQQLLNFCQVNDSVNEAFLSEKDKAHIKWKKFAERELTHQLLSIEEANEWFVTLFSKLKTLPSLKTHLEKLQTAYQALVKNNDDTTLNAFYDAACDIDKLLLKCKTDSVVSKEAQTLILDFLNTSMSAIVNSRLDKGDVFANESPKNPLLTSKAITLWLTQVQKNNDDFRSLIEQQIHQSQSIDHAVWHCKCILQVLEQQNPKEKIAKTGMQTLLRFWSQHEDNVTFTGEKYSDPKNHEATKSTDATLLNDSITLQHALKRVHEKLPRVSLFRVPCKIEKIEVHKESITELKQGIVL